MYINHVMNTNIILIHVEMYICIMKIVSFINLLGSIKYDFIFFPFQPLMKNGLTFHNSDREHNKICFNSRALIMIKC